MIKEKDKEVEAYFKKLTDSGEHMNHISTEEIHWFLCIYPQRIFPEHFKKGQIHEVKSSRYVCKDICPKHCDVYLKWAAIYEDKDGRERATKARDVSGRSKSDK